MKTVPSIVVSDIEEIHLERRGRREEGWSRERGREEREREGKEEGSMVAKRTDRRLRLLRKRMKQW